MVRNVIIHINIIYVHLHIQFNCKTNFNFNANIDFGKNILNLKKIKLENDGPYTNFEIDPLFIFEITLACEVY